MVISATAVVSAQSGPKPSPLPSPREDSSPPLSSMRSTVRVAAPSDKPRPRELPGGATIPPPKLPRPSPARATLLRRKADEKLRPSSASTSPAGPFASSPLAAAPPPRVTQPPLGKCSAKTTKNGASVPNGMDWSLGIEISPRPPPISPAKAEQRSLADTEQSPWARQRALRRRDALLCFLATS